MAISPLQPLRDACRKPTARRTSGIRSPSSARRSLRTGLAPNRTRHMPCPHARAGARSRSPPASSAKMRRNNQKTREDNVRAYLISNVVAPLTLLALSTPAGAQPASPTSPTPEVLRVTRTADDGEGSLRWAIERNNASPGRFRIEIVPDGPAPHVIKPASALPPIKGPVTIEGAAWKQQPDLRQRPRDRALLRGRQLRPEPAQGRDRVRPARPRARALCRQARHRGQSATGEPDQDLPG